MADDRKYWMDDDDFGDDGGDFDDGGDDGDDQDDEDQDDEEEDQPDDDDAGDEDDGDDTDTDNDSDNNDDDQHLDDAFASSEDLPQVEDDVFASAAVIDHLCAMNPAARLPSGIPPRNASMKIDITRPRIESVVASCTREL